MRSVVDLLGLWSLHLVIGGTGGGWGRCRGACSTIGFLTVGVNLCAVFGVISNGNHQLGSGAFLVGHVLAYSASSVTG